MNHPTIISLLKKLLSILTLAGMLTAQSPSSVHLTGFSEPAASDQFARETQVDSSLDRNNLQTWMVRLSAKPHHIGSAADKENAELHRSKLISILRVTKQPSRLFITALSTRPNYGASR